MSNWPDKCPECGAHRYPCLPYQYPKNRVHFRCESFGYNADKFELANRSELCREREKRITLEHQRDAALDKLNSHGPEGHNAPNWQFFKVRADRDMWRAHAEELVAACTLHYSGDDGEGLEKSADTFLRVMRAVEQINKSSEEARK